MAQNHKGTRQAELLRSYEHVRRIALEDPEARPRNPYGLALLLYQGLAAWMNTWTSCLGSLDPDAASAALCPRQSGDRESMFDMTSEVVSIMTTMILAQSREDNDHDPGNTT